MREVSHDCLYFKGYVSSCPNFFNGKDGTDFAKAVFQSLSIRLPANADPVTFLRDILHMLSKRPIFIVEVDKKFPSKSLEELLLLMKQLGDDSNLLKTNCGPVIFSLSSRFKHWH